MNIVFLEAAEIELDDAFNDVKLNNKSLVCSFSLSLMQRIKN